MQINNVCLFFDPCQERIRVIIVITKHQSVIVYCHIFFKNMKLFFVGRDIFFKKVADTERILYIKIV